MVKILLCGPARSGKTKLLEELQKRVKQCRTMRTIVGVTQKVLHCFGIQDKKTFYDEKLFYHIQREIISEQVKREEQFKDLGLISDSCLINAVVYSYHYLNDRSLEQNISDKLASYRNQFVVLLSPVQNTEHRNTQMRLSEDGWKEMKVKYLKIFEENKIPFLDVGSLDFNTRVDLITDALVGKITNDMLSFNMDSSESKNFPFYLTPRARHEQICIPTLKIFNDHIEKDWTIEEKGKTNRFMHKYGHDRLVMMAFDINIRASVVQKILLSEVRINGEIYNFLGCSSNGLKNRKCFMWRDSADEADAVIAENGNFSEIKPVSKRMARIGLLFSSVTITDIVISETQIIKEDDLEDNGKVFSDGCGGIGKYLAKHIYTEVKETEDVLNYIPAVYQIRLQGYKGVLALDTAMPCNSIKVRPSMEKFQTVMYPNICVCEYSKPYTFGKLNKQFIQLLSGLGVPDSVFEKKLGDYTKLIQSMLHDKEAAIMVFQWKGMFDIAQKIVSIPSTDALKSSEVKKRISEVQQNLVSSIEKLNILIPKSRNIFGVCDTTRILEYGQCFVRITESGVPKTLRGQVIVCKSPSYLLGDVRVLEAVDLPDIAKGAEPLKKLVDCIVFPSKGLRPHPDEIAGSDLDGDMYFVCWDETLIPPATRQAYDYPGASDRFMTNRVTRESVINYFSKQNETRKMVSKVDKYFNKWADSEGVNSKECERLGRLFSRVIDASKTGEPVNIPTALTGIEDDISSDKYVWVKMKRQANLFKQEFGAQLIQQNQNGLTDHVTKCFVKEIVGQPVSNITEYDKFQFILNFLHAIGTEPTDVIDAFLREYADYINFAMFSVVEKRSAEALGIPHATITNALNKSKILTKEDISCFQMHTSASPWNFYFRHAHDQFDWVHLIKALTEQDRTCIVFKMPNQVTVVLQFMQRQVLGIEQEVSPGTVCALLYSKHFGLVRKYILGPSYLLDFTRDTLQLYRQTKPKTFIWLRAQDWPKNARKNEKVVSEEIVNAVSVDLQRFDKRILEGNKKHPLITKTPLITMEVFAQNKSEADCYFDLVDVNDTVPVDDVKEEDADEGIASVNFDELFPKTVHDTDIDSHDELSRLLKSATETGNPYLFQSILEHWLQADFTCDVLECVSKLLESVVRATSPMPLPEEMAEVLEAIIVLTEKEIDNYTTLLRIARLLYQLHCDNVAHALVDKTSSREIRITGDEYIDILLCWQDWWFLESATARFFVDKTYCCLMESLLQSADSQPNEIQSKEYTTYFSRLEGLSLIQEMQSHKDGILLDTSKNGDRTSSLDVAEKRLTDSESCISFLKVDPLEDAENDLVTFYRMSAIAKRPNICKGHYIALARHVDFKANPTYKSYCCLGQIRDMRLAPFTMSVELTDIIPDVLEKCLHSKQTVFWRAEVIGNITTYLRVMKSVKKLSSVKSSENSAMLSYIIHPSGFIKESALYKDKPNSFTVDVTPAPCFSGEGLKQAQSDAVKTAIEQSITLIQGPPGTGKTTCACSIVKNIRNLQKYEKILVVAETNIAVDNIARRLKDDLLVLRVGTDEGVAPDLYDITLAGQMQKISESIDAKRTTFRDEHGMSHRNKQLVSKILNSSDVVLTTCAGAGDPLLESEKFEFVLVDEATQTMEPNLLCSLVHGAKHLVMIGDPKQLGPHILDNETNQTIVGLPGLKDLSTTIFHRFYETGVIPNICFLDTQHRMHEAIMKFPSEWFYDNKLHSGVSGGRAKVNFPWPKKNVPLCFVDISGPNERRVGTSYCNLHESKAVQQIVDCLLNVDEEQRETRLSIDDIGILTTYKAQVKALRQHIKLKIEVSSVDGFQGREKEVIVVSLVRANNSGSLGFSDDRNRINVLLTRAKRGLIVVGNERTLNTSDVWKAWLRQAPRLNLSDTRRTVSDK